MANKKYTKEQVKEALELYKKNHEAAKYVPARTTITLSNGSIVNLGNLLNSIKSGNTEISGELREYIIGLFPNQFENNRKTYNEEQIKEALTIYKKKHQESTYIPRKAVVTLKDGTKINLGNLGYIIKRGNINISADLSSYILSLFPNQLKNNARVYKEEQLKEALLIYKNEHQESTYIPQKTVVTLKDGTNIRLGTWGNNIKSEGYNISEDLKEFVISLYPKHFKNNKVYTDENLMEIPNSKEEEPLDTYEEEIMLKKRHLTIDKVLKKFNLNIDELNFYLEKIRINKEIDISKPIDYRGKTLRSYCLEQGYNYDIVKKAIRLYKFCKHDTFDQLINRVLITSKQDENTPSTWIYEKYGNLIGQVLIYLGLDSNAILKNMSQNVISLEEAIRHDIFLKEKKNTVTTWLEEPFNYFIARIDNNKSKEENEQDLVIYFSDFVKKYNLTQVESKVLQNSITRYINVMREYQIVDVGLETKEGKKIKKITKYNLNAEEIEESFFVPLAFDQGVLLGRQSELYKRRQLLRQYIIDWDYFTDEEKDDLQSTFTKEELYYINNSREKINETVKVLRKK